MLSQLDGRAPVSETGGEGSIPSGSVRCGGDAGSGSYPLLAKFNSWGRDQRSVLDGPGCPPYGHGRRFDSSRCDRVPADACGGGSGWATSTSVGARVLPINTHRRRASGCREMVSRLFRVQETASSILATPIDRQIVVELPAERRGPAVRWLRRALTIKFLRTTSQLETAAVPHTALAEFDPQVVHVRADVAQRQRQPLQERSSGGSNPLVGIERR